MDGWGLMENRYDNEYAIKQIEEGHHSLISREPASDASKPGPSLKGKTLPRVVNLLPPACTPSEATLTGISPDYPRW